MRTLWFLVVLASCVPKRDPRPATDPNCASPVYGESGRFDARKPPGVPHHVAMDSVAVAGQDVYVYGKFSYGDIHKDLEHETVELWVTDKPCGTWRKAGSATTDDDGRVGYRLPPSSFTNTGTHAYRWRVVGDDSEGFGNIFILDPEQPIVVFDVDATITNRNSDLLSEIRRPGSSQPREGAREVAQFWTDAGAQVVYITARHYSLHSRTAFWLNKYNFPKGPIYTTQSWRMALRKKKGAEVFKIKKLNQLKNLGVTIEAAYGNAGTDTCAYLRAGIPNGRTFIVDADNLYCDRVGSGTYIPGFHQHLKWLNKASTD